MAWIILVLSGVLEAVWATALGKSEGFTKPLPTAVFGVAVILSMAGLAYAMRTLPTGTSYAIWTGIGAALTVSYAMIVGDEAASVLKVLLITGIIASRLREGSFSLREFYARRIRRIFPALIVVLVACLVIGWFTLLSGEYAQLGRHVAAASAFVVNLVLSWESGYFDTAAALKPLLHLWSLGVEGQLYVMWPLLFVGVLAFTRRRVAVTLALAVLAAVAMALQYDPADTTLAYYATWTRASGFLVGAALAVVWRPQSWVRPRPRAPVSMPLTWDEVEAGARIEDFRIDNAPARLERLGDLYAPMLARTGRFRLEHVA